MIRKKLNRKKVNRSTPVYTGIEYSSELSMQLFTFNKDEFKEYPDFSIHDFAGFSESKDQNWLNIHGLHDTQLILNICKKLGVHDLAIQDILDVNQRPKFQNYEKYWFFTLKSIIPGESSNIELEQLSFVLGNNFLVSFQERKADYFDHIRQRIRNNIGIVRERGSDYLLFLLLEAIMDNYFITINDIESKIDDLDFVDVETDPSPQLLKTIEHFKRQIHQVKKTIVPIKEFIAKIEREKFGFINEKHIKYFYEIRDLCLLLIDDCEKIELRLESSINLFFSVQGHRMNQVMKTLTVVATTFIPLTFVAGVYGMNFANMPELNWKWGYALIWAIMLSILAGMLIYFKRKKWF